MSNLQPKLPSDYPKSMYIGMYTFNDGIQWLTLKPEFDMGEAKRRLRSRIPDKEHIHNRGFRCGLLIVNTKAIESASEFVEVNPESFAQ